MNVETERSVAYQNVLWVLDSGNNAGSEHQFLPSLSQIDQMNTFSVSFEDVRLHEVSAVHGSLVALWSFKSTQDLPEQQSSAQRPSLWSLNKRMSSQNS